MGQLRSLEIEAGRLFYHVSQDNRDFEIQRRGQQGERQKTIGLISKTTTSHVHHTMTRKCLISRFMEDVNKQRQNFIFLSQLGYGHLKFSFRRIRLHLQNRA